MIQLSIFIFIITGILSLLLLRKQSLQRRIAIAVIISFALIALLRALMIMNGDPPSPGSTEVKLHQEISEPVAAGYR